LNYSYYRDYSNSQLLGTAVAYIRVMSNGNVQNTDEQLSDAGGKSSWEETVSGAPTSGEDDPKAYEPRKGDMSEREGGPGKNPPSDDAERT
jgi:hypothetical protein